MAPQHYSEGALKAIGQQCSNRLPPASAMQGMVLYEMQRARETECLFQHQMFQLARAEDHSQAQDKRIAELSDQVKDLQKRLTNKELEERLSTSKVRVDALQGKFNQYNQQLGEQGELLATLEKQLQILETAKDLPPKVMIASQNDQGLVKNI